MKARRDIIALCFLALALALACIPSAGTPVATADPNQIDLFIAQTADAARTRTARALPTATGTATITPTQTSSPTFTATVLFILPSATDTITPTFALGGGGTNENDFACEVLSVTPASGTSFRSRDSFDVTWRVRNIGQRKWNEDVISYAFESGDAMHTVASHVLQSDVSRGDILDATVEMQAPAESGMYSTTWALRRGENSFCQMFLTIIVR